MEKSDVSVALLFERAADRAGYCDRIHSRCPVELQPRLGVPDHGLPAEPSWRAPGVRASIPASAAASLIMLASLQGPAVALAQLAELLKA